MSRGRYEYRVKEIRWLFWIADGCFAAHAIKLPFDACGYEDIREQWIEGITVVGGLHILASAIIRLHFSYS